MHFQRIIYYNIFHRRVGQTEIENVVERSFRLGIPCHYFLETNEKFLPLHVCDVKNVSLALYCPRKFFAVCDRYVIWFFKRHSETSEKLFEVGTTPAIKAR